MCLAGNIIFFIIRPLRAIHMTPEWISFQKEFRTVFTWQNRPAQPKAFSLAGFLRQIRKQRWRKFRVNYACATHPDYTVCGVHLGTKFVFSLHDTRMKCHTRTRISFRMKTGMNSFRNDLYGNEISSRYHVNKYREIYRGGINPFQNENHSGIDIM